MEVRLAGHGLGLLKWYPRFGISMEFRAVTVSLPPHSELAVDKKKRRADLAKLLATFEAHPLLKVTGWG